VPANTDLNEGNPGGLIDHASLWLFFTTTNAGVLGVDTSGSSVDTLFALYAYGPGVNLDNLANHLLGWATNSANATGINSVRATNGPAGGSFLALVAGSGDQRGAVEVRWAFGTLPQETNAQAQLPAVDRVANGAKVTLQLDNAAITSATPPPQYWWYRDGMLVGQTATPQYGPFGVTPELSGTYSVVASNALGMSTNVLERLLALMPVQVIPGSGRYVNGAFELGLSGTEGDAVKLEAAVDLKTWSVLLSTNLTGYQTTFTDTNASAFRRRFYLLRPGP
jgi:hypothetical protein